MPSHRTMRLEASVSSDPHAVASAWTHPLRPPLHLTRAWATPGRSSRAQLGESTWSLSPRCAGLLSPVRVYSLNSRHGEVSPTAVFQRFRGLGAGQCAECPHAPQDTLALPTAMARHPCAQGWSRGVLPARPLTNPPERRRSSAPPGE